MLQNGIVIIEKTGASTRGIHWKQVVPWLALIVAVLFLAWPVTWLQTGLGVLKNRMEMKQPGFGSDFGSSKLVAESPHFRLLAYEKYANQTEADAFLAHAEVQYPKLSKFLDIPLSDHPITIVLLPQCDISHGGINFLTVNTCNSRLQPLMSNIFVHELTHALMEPQYTARTNSFLSEGLAVATGREFEWGVPLIFDDDIYIYEVLRTGQLIPLTEMRLGISASQYDATTGLRYAEAGSFVRYLIDTYGTEKFLMLFESGDDFKGVYNLPFAQLENDWLQSLRVGNLMQVLILMLGGVIVLWLIHLAITHGWHWIPAVIIGWLAFLLWSFLLGTSDAMGLLYVILYRPVEVPPIPYEVIAPIWVPAGLVLATLLGAVISRWKKRAGGIVLWLTGIGTMIAFLIIPAVNLFFE
jgi:hypothetical protein